MKTACMYGPCLPARRSSMCRLDDVSQKTERVRCFPAKKGRLASSHSELTRRMESVSLPQSCLKMRSSSSNGSFDKPSGEDFPSRFFGKMALLRRFFIFGFGSCQSVTGGLPGACMYPGAGQTSLGLKKSIKWPWPQFAQSLRFGQPEDTTCRLMLNEALHRHVPS